MTREDRRQMLMQATGIDPEEVRKESMPMPLAAELVEEYLATYTMFILKNTPEDFRLPLLAAMAKAQGEMKKAMIEKVITGKSMTELYPEYVKIIEDLGDKC